MTHSLFTLSGRVKPCLQRGRQLGYPTANLEVQTNTPEGIFIAYSLLSGKKFPSLLFVGAAVTFNEQEKKGEVYILDYSQDIYGQDITVEAVEKLRDNKKFDTPKALIEQMKMDEEAARAFFTKHKDL